MGTAKSLIFRSGRYLQALESSWRRAHVCRGSGENGVGAQHGFSWARSLHRGCIDTHNRRHIPVLGLMEPVRYKQAPMVP